MDRCLCIRNKRCIDGWFIPLFDWTGILDPRSTRYGYALASLHLLVLLFPESIRVPSVHFAANHSISILVRGSSILCVTFQSSVIMRISNQDLLPPCLVMVFVPVSSGRPLSPPPRTPHDPSLSRSTDPGQGFRARPASLGCLRLCRSQLCFSDETWPWTTATSPRPRDRRGRRRGTSTHAT